MLKAKIRCCIWIISFYCFCSLLNTIHSDLINSRITTLISYAAFFNFLWYLHHDIFTCSSILCIKCHNGMCGRGRPGKEIQNNCIIRGKSLYTRPDGTHWSTVLDNTVYKGDQIYNACLIYESKKPPTADAVLAAWMKSSEHRVLVLALQHRSTGMYTGYSAKNKRYYTVQLFSSLVDAQNAAEPESRQFVAAGRVNVRAGAGTAYEKIGKLKKGERIQVTGILYDAKKKAAWAMADYQGNTGCVSLRYLNIDAQ